MSVLEQLETGLEVLECLIPSYFKVFCPFESLKDYKRTIAIGCILSLSNTVVCFQGLVNLQAKISLHLNADNKSQVAPTTEVTLL